MALLKTMSLEDLGKKNEASKAARAAEKAGKAK